MRSMRKYFFCNKTSITEKCFIYSPHLVNTKCRVRNSSLSFIFSCWSGYTHKIHNLQHCTITKFCFCNKLCIFRIKDMSLQGFNRKYIMKRILLQCLFICVQITWISFIDHSEQLRNGIINIVSF